MHTIPIEALDHAERVAFVDRVEAADTFDDLNTADRMLIVQAEAVRTPKG
jgi:hypothetical protein